MQDARNWLIGQQAATGAWLSEPLAADRRRVGYDAASAHELTTAHAMIGLLANGHWQLSEPEKQAVAQGAAYLIQAQHSEGQWGPIGWAQPFILWSLSESLHVDNHVDTRQAIAAGVRCSLASSIRDQRSALPLGWPATRIRAQQIHVEASMWHALAFSSIIATGAIKDDPELIAAVQHALAGLLSLSTLIEYSRDVNGIAPDMSATSLTLRSVYVNAERDAAGANLLLRLVNRETMCQAWRRLRQAGRTAFQNTSFDIQRATFIAWADLCSRDRNWGERGANRRWQHALQALQQEDGSWDFAEPRWRGSELGPVADTT